MNSAQSPPLRAWLSVITFLDALLYLDMTLRWEAGFGFARADWLIVAVLWLAVVGAGSAMLLRFRTSAWVHACFGFAAVTLAFVLSSTGSAAFHWRKMPLLSQVMRQTGLDYYWAVEGGLATALCGALVHALLGGGFRQGASPPHVPGPLRLGLSLLAASAVGLIQPMPIFVDMTMPDGTIRAIDPRSAVPAVVAVRGTFWLCSSLLGLILLALSGYRRWLEPRPGS